MSRGRLPARVYWVRRVVVLGAVALLVAVVVGAVRLVAGPGTTEQAQQVSAGTEAGTSASADPSADATADATASAGQSTGQRKKKRTATATPTPTPAEPEGTCEDSQVVVTPTVGTVYAGAGATFTLELSTRKVAACWFDVSPRTVVVKVSDDDGEVWSTRECRRALTDLSVSRLAVRRDSTTPVSLAWSGRESDEGCTVSTDWAEPGEYELQAASLGGEAGSTTFTITTP
ncbi:hypothetical protein [Nocardioides bruguierae]|uniref:hypothetical protein n=1 Tax=Nocardioides bruguierae TaxID=2945102 RepID=UPI002021726A|nr:hypothetical protein [Nocardioides bruguierae]MCL8026199.1 hypothetical protein [Nocardioides bruguierae]